MEQEKILPDEPEKKASQTEIIENWFEEEFWPLYKVFVKTPFVSKFGAGTKGEAKKKVLKERYKGTLRIRIIEAIRAQMNHRRAVFEKAGSAQKYTEATRYQKLYNNRHAVTWLNQLGYEDEIPGSVEIEETLDGDRAISQKCCHEGCEADTHGPSISWCIDHYPDTMGTDSSLKENLKESGMWKKPDETIEQWRLRCQKVARQQLKNMGIMR